MKQHPTKHQAGGKHSRSGAKVKVTKVQAAKMQIVKAKVKVTKAQVAKNTDKTTDEQGVKPMSAAEVVELKRLENTIETHFKKFFEVGNALARISNEELYRAQHRTFDEYCLAKWGFGRTYGYRHIRAATVYNGIRGLLPNGDTTLPQCEAQVRPMTRLKEPDKMLRAWNAAVKKANGGRVTEEVVTEVVATITGATNRKKRNGAKPVEEVQPTLKPDPTSAINTTEILKLLEAIRASLEEDNHRAVLKCVREIESLVTGDQPTKGDEVAEEDERAERDDEDTEGKEHAGEDKHEDGKEEEAAIC